MFGYVGWKFRGEGRVDREVCWDYAKCGSWSICCWSEACWSFRKLMSGGFFLGKGLPR
ncbi:hypothetical protein HanRHA438_Chr11g0507041 [Helianthus annuus]|nr:hypothetical protein HanHA89_Chr11g0429061 [Helianthus annuus]KAJ0685747.1 hypothetical protein HanLR1_Chr11g0406551 [Helianthus annuus]KAJ0870988.1 hypothetical protein HanRHA438_Chr11g0507041 [Helianthus annuus]KAJ0875431.1 hypothetical protein HanPSC8_Chr11g0476361 [Helianthus annuus]